MDCKLGGLDGKEAPLTQIEDMATDYIKALRIVQPHGPYMLGGWSFGGVVAFEMAQQLQKLGNKVALLALIDIGAPIEGSKRAQLDDATLLAWFALDFGIGSEQELALLVNTLRGVELEEQLHYLLAQAKKAKILPSTAELDDIRPLVRVFKSNVKALQSYVPKVYSNRMTLFRASESLSLQAGESFDGSIIEPIGSILEWGKLSLEPIEIYTILGNHYTIIAEPHVEHLGKQLRRCIDTIHVD